MLKIGVTGSNGFIGYHLCQTLLLHKDEFSINEFKRDYFDNLPFLDDFVSKCDVIIHLAALNRHNNQDVIYNTNTSLVKILISALERTNTNAHLIISSSTQEEKENIYGKSKREGRLLLSEWAKQSGSRFTGLIIPNVFGPFGTPFYNSVVATFCYQIASGVMPTIEVDNDIHLIYVGQLVDTIINLIRAKDNTHNFQLPSTAKAKVSQIKRLLEYYRLTYQDNAELPKLDNEFEKNLFNTYRSYINMSDYFPRKFQQHKDNRGSFVEIARVGISGQTSFSTTKPGITRGNHFHTRKIERFAVIKGKALIQLRKI